MKIFIAILVVLASATPSWAGTLAGLAGLGGLFGSGSILGLVIRTVITVGLSLLLQRNAKPQSQGPAQIGFTTMGGTGQETSILGLYATPGHRVYHNSHGWDNRYYTQIIEVGGLPGLGLNRVILDGEYSDIGTTAHAEYGFPLLSKRTGGADYAWLEFHDGNQVVANPMLVDKYGADPDRPWTSDHILTGIPYVVVTFLGKRSVFKSGRPEMRFEMRGMPFYDPRADSSIGGTGSQRWDDPSTWLNSENPSVQMYNILRGILLPGGEIWGGNMAAEDLPLSNWVAAMNACDVPVSTLPSGTRPRYRAGLEIRFADQPADVITELLAACNAQISELGGISTIQVDAPETPSATITDNDILTSKTQDFAPFPGRQEIYNGVSLVHPSPNIFWNPRELEPIRNSDYEAEDGERRVFDLQLPAVSNPGQARQLGNDLLRDNRRMRKHGIPLPPDLFFLQPLKTLSWSSEWNGYSDKLFEITDAAYDLLTFTAIFSLRERDPADFSHEGVLDLPDAPAVIIPFVISAIEVPSFSVVPTFLENDAEQARRPALLVTWDGSKITDTVDGVLITVRVASTSAVTFQTTVTDVINGQAVISNVLPSTVYEVRAEAVSTRRGTLPTAWLTVTTPDVRFDYSALADIVLNDFDEIRTRLLALDAVGNSIALQQLVAQYEARKANTADLAFASQDLRSLVDENRVAVAELATALGARIDTSEATILLVSLAYAAGDAALAETIATLTATVGDNTADITTASQASVDGDSALAASITALTATVGDNSASVVAQSTAIADLEGNASAGVMFKVGAGSALSFLNLIAADGTASPFSLAHISATEILLSGTVTADLINVLNLSAVSAEMGDLSVTGTLWLEDLNSSIIAGRSSLSDYDEPGFHFARVDRGGVGLGFEAAITAVTSEDQLSGFIAQDGENLKIYNPRFLVGGDATGGTEIYSTGQTINLGQPEMLDSTIIGGGGSGGAGEKDNNASRGNAGSTTTLKVYDGDPAGVGVLKQTWTATGGLGGPRGRSTLAGALNAGARDGANGQGSTFGIGGAGGWQESNGAAGVGYGAGGGGGGGNTPTITEYSTGAGAGGLAGQIVTIAYDTSNFTNDVYVVLTVGSGGAVSGDNDFYTGNGGAGRNGAAAISSVFAGLREVSLGPSRVKSWNHGVDGNTTITGLEALDLVQLQITRRYGFHIKTSIDGGSTWGGPHDLGNSASLTGEHLILDLATGVVTTSRGATNGDWTVAPTIQPDKINAINLYSTGGGRASGTAFGQSII